MQDNPTIMDQVGVTFVNALINRGIFNGVFNLNFGTFLFTPQNDGQIEPQLVVSCRMRMDENCAAQLHRELGLLLQLIEEQKAKLAGSVPPQSSGVSTETKPN